MWKAKYCTSWLQEQYIEESGSETSLKSIFSKYKLDGGALSQIAVGKNIQSLFPNVKVHRKWFVDEKKEGVLYKGLKEKNVVDEETFNDISFILQSVPSPFFACKNDDQDIQLAMFCDLVNGNHLIKKITFCRNGEWELHVGEHQINLEEISVEKTFRNTSTSVQNVCNLVYKLHTCRGKESKNIDSLEIPSCKNYVVEYLGVQKNKTYRAISCKRLLPPTATSLTCRNCQNSLRFNSPVTGMSSKKLKLTDSVQSSTATAASSSEENNENDIILTNSNDEDMRTILEKVLPEATGEMIDLLVNQKQNLARHPKGRRWDQKTLSLCLSLWCRSRKNYEQLRDSKVLILPSGITLYLYKSAVEQDAGFNKDVFLWMREEAKKHKPSNSQYLGGVCFDEMSIQEDLCMVKTNGETRLVGFVDMGADAENLNVLCSGKKERALATHVLQFLYLGLDGFRFPFACFPVTQTKAGNLHFLFWQAVKFLNMYDFQVLFVSMDGAQTNRDFMKMFFSESSPSLGNFSTKNIWSPNDPNIIFIMDYSHVIKRVRNNILKSGKGKTYIRHLCYNQYIYWEHWLNAFRWDRETNAFPLHRKLTNDHFFLSQESKMRNHLAEDVMDSEMLHLMECFQKSLGNDGYLLDDTVRLLRATSMIVSTFRDHRPVTDIEDVRLDNIMKALGWFNDWVAHVNEKDGLSAPEKEKQIMSKQTCDDLNSCITGFSKLCQNTLKQNRNSIVPSRVNSDVIENIFCQQRGIINGNNTNPTFHQYVKNINSIIIGQNTVSKNSNAAQKGCEPLCFNIKRPVKGTKKSSNEKLERKPLSALNQ